MRQATKVLVGPPPHVFAPQSTATLAWGTVLLLGPSLLWGLYCFGLDALLPVAASILAALVGELAVGLVRKHFTLGDGTAFLTGLLIGLSMPPSVPIQIPVLASLFAICLVKGAFGGLGSNWMNPALAGLAFSLLNWPKAMGKWSLPRQLAEVSGLSGATPLGFIHAKLSLEAGAGDALGVLGAAGQQWSALDKSLSGGLNRYILNPLGLDLPSGYLDLLFGNKAGAIGELSGILLLAASIVLISRRMIRWEIPASIFSSYALLTWAFGGIPFGSGFFSGDILFGVLSGSFLLVTFFMATDPVTSPSSSGGMLIYGLGIGLLTFLLRRFGSGAEGTVFAVLVMNCFVPAIDKLETAGWSRRKGLQHG